MKSIKISIVIFCIISNSIIHAQVNELLLPTVSELEKTYSHTHHTFSYNTSYRLSSWVCYWVTTQLSDPEREIKMKFLTDPLLSVRAAEKSDYKKSGYVPGQFMNSKEIAKDNPAIKESFYLSNMAPMKSAFYKFSWLGIENVIRFWAKETDLQVTTGPVLTESPYATIGKNKIIIPKHFYKIVYDPVQQRAIGFLIKNGNASGTPRSHTRSIDEIENLTGIDFLHELPDEVESKIEGTNQKDEWNWDLN